MDDRELLLTYALATVPPSCRVELPRGAERVDQLDLVHVDVKAVLSQIRRAAAASSQVKGKQGEQEVIDLKGCSLRQRLPQGPSTAASPSYESDVFVWGWRDYEEFIRPEKRRIAVKPPPPQSSESPRRNSAGGSLENSVAKLQGAAGSFHPDVEPLDDMEPSPAKPSCDEAVPPELLNFAGPEFPEPINIEAASVVTEALFEPLESNPDLLNAVVYDNVLLIVRLFLDLSPDRAKLVGEVLEMVRPSLGISNAHHTDAVRALCLPALSHVVDPSSKTSHLQKHPPTSLPPEGALVGPTLNYIRLARTSNANAADFVKRTNIVTKMECMRVPEGTNEYPLVFRALIYAGLVGLLYHNDPTYSVDSDDLSKILPLAKQRLALTESVAACAKVHSILMRYRALPNPTDVSQAAVQMHFVKCLSDALSEMQLPGSDDDEVLYFSYVLQRVFQFCVVPLVQCETVSNEEFFGLVSEVFTEAAAVSPPQFFAKCLCWQFGDSIVSESGALTTEVMFYFVVSHLLCSPMYSEFLESKNELSQDVPLPQLINVLAGMYDTMHPVAAIWSAHVPNASALLLPGIVRMLSVVLWIHWGPVFKKKDQIPQDFASITEAVNTLLSGLAAPHVENLSVMRNVHSSIEDFGWIAEFGKRRIEEIDDELHTLLEAMMMNTCWYDAKFGSGAHGSSFDIFAMFHQLFPPLHLLVVPSSTEIFTVYVEKTVTLLREFAMRVSGPLEFSTKAQVWEADFAHLSGFVKLHAFHCSKVHRLQSVFTQMGLAEVVLRLNTLAQAFDNLKSYCESMKAKHKTLAAVAGGSNLDIKHIEATNYRALRAQIDDICEFLAMRTVRYELHDLLVEQLYRLDMAFYKKNKGNKKLLEEDPHGHLIFEHRHVTVAKLLSVLDNALMVFLPFVVSIPMRERISAFVFFHFLLAYYDVLLHSEERFFYPDQSSMFFNDVCAVEEFFHSAIADQSMPEMQGAMSFLSAIKCIITLIMALPTQQLLEGSDTIVKYSDLPVVSPTSPFSKHVVWHVLAHRKDQMAKKFVSNHPNPDARKH